MADENVAAAPEAADEFEAAFGEFSDARDEGEEVVAEEAPQAEEPAAEPEANAESPKQGEEPKAEAAPAGSTEQQKIDWEHRFKSEVGRQAAYQRQIAELKQQLETVKKQPSESKGSGKQAQTEHMKRLMEDFPEIAEAMQAEIESVVGELRGELKQSLAPVKEAEQQRYVQREEETVKGTYPNYTQLVNTTEFFDWYSRQPEAVQALARSDKAGDAIAMLDYYTGGKRTSAESSPVQEIREKRQQALQRNVSVRSTAPAPLVDAPDDFESAFNHFSAKLEKRRA